MHNGFISNAFLILLLFFGNFGILFLDIWLGVWSSDILGLSLNLYLASYIFISVVTIIVVFMGEVVFRNLARKGLKIFYNTIVDALLESDLDFYDRVPVNRLVYRLTKDLLIVDDDLINSMTVTLKAFFFTFGGMMVLFYTTLGIYVLFWVAAIIIFLFQLSRMMSRSFQFLQMANEGRSDLLALLLKVLKCSLVLRNFGKENYFDTKMNTTSNNY